MRVLITRPRPDAEALAALIASRGHSTLIAPLINIRLEEGPELDLSQIRAIILTSANGARAAAKRTAIRSIPVIAVGPRTASQAKEVGFQLVTQSSGQGVEGLVAHIRANLPPQDGPLLHLTGSVIAGDLAEVLKQARFLVHTQRIYKADAAKKLPQGLREELKAGRIDAAMFFSPRTAATFAALLNQEGLSGSCAAITALTLSASVAKSLDTLTFRKVLIAHNTIEEAMLSLLETA